MTRLQWLRKMSGPRPNYVKKKRRSAFEPKALQVALIMKTWDSHIGAVSLLLKTMLRLYKLYPEMCAKEKKPDHDCSDF